jgi:hypothetical protein
MGGSIGHGGGGAVDSSDGVSAPQILERNGLPGIGDYPAIDLLQSIQR